MLDRVGTSHDRKKFVVVAETTYADSGASVNTLIDASRVVLIREVTLSDGVSARLVKFDVASMEPIYVLDSLDLLRKLVTC